MTPPPPTELAHSNRPSLDTTSDDITRLRWAGWVALWTISLGWIGWISLRGIATHVIEDRQQTQYDQLREDIAELKDLIKTALNSHR